MAGRKSEALVTKVAGSWIEIVIDNWDKTARVKVNKQEIPPDLFSQLRPGSKISCNYKTEARRSKDLELQNFDLISKFDTTPAEITHPRRH